MAKKKIEGLQESKDIKLKQVKKSSDPKKANVAQLSPKAKNKDSLTENIKARSAKSVEGGSLGKTYKVPLSLKSSNQKPKKK